MLTSVRQGPLAVEEKQNALDNILQSSTFSRSEQLRQFLKFVAEMEIADRPEEITEYLIGVHALGRAPNFLPMEDATVRTRARLLRLKLAEYHEREAPDVLVKIELPKGSYVPRFSKIEPPSEPDVQEPTPVREQPPSSSSSIVPPDWRLIIGAIVIGLLLGAGAMSTWFAYRIDGKEAFVDPIIAEAWGPMAEKNATVLVCLGTWLQFVPEIQQGKPESPLAFKPPADVISNLRSNNPVPPDFNLYLMPNETVRVGESMGAIAATRLLTEMGVVHEVVPENLIRKPALRSRNVMLLGQPENSAIAASFLADERLPYHFDLTKRALVDRAGNYIQNEKGADGDWTVYGLITVMPSLGSGDGKYRTVILSGIDSAGSHAALEYFSSPACLASLKQRFQKENDSGFPNSYQVIVKCRTDGAAALSFEYYQHAVANL